MIQPTQRRLLKTKEAAIYLRYSAGTLRQRVHDGQIPVIVFETDGHEWRFDIRDLDAYIDAHRQTGA